MSTARNKQADENTARSKQKQGDETYADLINKLKEYEDLNVELAKNLRFERFGRHKENKALTKENASLKQGMDALENKNNSLKKIIDNLKQDINQLVAQAQETPSLKVKVKELTYKAEALERLNHSLIQQSNSLKQQLEALERLNHSLVIENNSLKQQLQEKDKASEEFRKLTINPANSRMINLKDERIEPSAAAADTKPTAADATTQSRYALLSWLPFSKKAPGPIHLLPTLKNHIPRHPR